MEKKTRLRILFSRNVLHTKQYNPKIIALIIHVKIIIKNSNKIDNYISVHLHQISSA